MRVYNITTYLSFFPELHLYTGKAFELDNVQYSNGKFNVKLRRMKGIQQRQHPLGQPAHTILTEYARVCLKSRKRNSYLTEYKIHVKQNIFRSMSVTVTFSLNAEFC